VTEATPYIIERIAPRAANYLRRLPRKQQEAIAEAFEHLCKVSPFRHPKPTTIKALKGKYKGKWRYKVGDIRIIYTVNEEKRTIRVAEIDNRGDVY
jgi:mRNA interferase RelE/StbE